MRQVIPFFVRPADRIDHPLHPQIGQDPQFDSGREPDRSDITDSQAQPVFDFLRSGQVIRGIEEVARLISFNSSSPRSKTATNSSFTVKKGF